jgi:hemerythrin-like domain-containing protein
MGRVNVKGKVTGACTRRGVVVVAAAWFAAMLAGCATEARPRASDDGREQPSKEFRAHHAEVLEHLGHVDAMAARLGGETPEQQRRTMDRIVGFFKEHIGPHAIEEERVLYPAVQQRAGRGNRLTEVPIYEHRIVERWIGELEAQAAKPEPDAAAFAQRAVHLVGLLRAHFEVEEQVLLPVLDATMTPAEFKREVGDRMAH